jgi:hypothetical protein
MQNEYYWESDVFTEFRRDPRFSNKIPDSLSHLDAAVKFLEHTYSPAKVDLKGLELVQKNRGLNEDQRSQLRKNFFITWKDLGIQAINKLVYHRVPFVGLVEGTVTVDGGFYDALGFFHHDLIHFHISEERSTNKSPIYGPDRFSQRHFQALNYDQIVSELNPSDRVLFDVAYFVFFHEAFGQTIGLQVTATAEDFSVERLREIYKRSFPNFLEMSFDPSTMASLSSFKKDPAAPSSLVSRFLNKADLALLMPNEVLLLVGSLHSRDKKAEVVTEFLNQCFSLFMTYHYQVYLKLLSQPR